MCFIVDENQWKPIFIFKRANGNVPNVAHTTWHYEQNRNGNMMYEMRQIRQFQSAGVKLN